MNKLACAIGALAAAVAWTCPVFAENMTIKQTAKPLEYTYPGVSLDILGLKLGMTLGQVEKTIAGYSKNKPTLTSANMSMTYKTVTVASQNFTSKLVVQKDGQNSITVYFGSPATGNRVVHIDRVMYFPDTKTAPTIKVLNAALDKKYGPPTKTELSPTKLYRLWDFGRHKLRASCPKSDDAFCEAVSYGYGAWGDQRYDPHENSYYSPAHLYRKSYAFGNYVNVAANISAAGDDSSRVRKVLLSLSDQADEAITYDQALKQLQAAAIAAYNKETPGAAPKL